VKHLHIRLLDIVLAFCGLIMLSPLTLLIFFISFFDTKSPLFIQTRVGRNLRPFQLIKFRTMKINTASVATHLVSPSSVTSFGSFLRRTKLDEIPQLWNVLKGEMSLVGPRPCLFSQEELIQERQDRKVFDVRPGITGLAQVNGIDMSAPILLAETDAKMIKEYSTLNYFKYIVQTVLGSGQGDRIKLEK
jgi:lipopolysaccharide/colanic/teichoic acid biosynthesis glycosyltransferase